MSRKILREYENPFENIILDTTEPLLPTLKSLGFTPNMLTTYSFIFGLLSIYYLSKRNIHAFAITFLISYIFDCMDGVFARKYNMTSEFGDLYDHISDVIVGILLFYTAYNLYKKEITFKIILLFSIFTYLSQMHMGCQQKMYNKSTETINILQNLCHNKNDIKWTRFFAPISYIIFCILLVYYLEYLH